MTTYPTAVALGSTSRHKVAALRDALDRAGLAATRVIPVEVGSGVDAQPIGDVTDLGAETRALGALAKVPRRVAYAVGVESGLVAQRGRWVDTATVVIVQRKWTAVVGFATSLGLPVPPEYVSAMLARGQRRTTVGEVVAEELGGDATDPHTTLTRGRLSRAKILADAIYAALIQVF